VLLRFSSNIVNDFTPEEEAAVIAENKCQSHGDRETEERRGMGAVRCVNGRAKESVGSLLFHCSLLFCVVCLCAGAEES
jgi:hypothetical protein